jgi:flagellar motor switch protein FliM
MDAKADSSTIGAADRLLDNQSLSVDRLPMLAVIFDRLAAACAEGMRPYSPAVLNCFVSSIATDPLWDALEAHAGGVAAILHSPELDARVLIGLDRRCMFSLMELLLGGDGQEPAGDDGRNFSTLETRVAQVVLEIAAEALRDAFGAVVATTFELERIETHMDFTVMGRRNTLAIVAKILFQAMDMDGQMFIVIPQAALAPIRPQLSRDRAGDGAANDPRWRKLMRRGVQKTEVRAVAVLDEQTLTLGEISSWRVGDVAPLMASAGAMTRLDCKDQPLFWCELSQANGHFTLKLVEPVDVEEAPLAQFLERAIAGETRKP